MKMPLVIAESIQNPGRHSGEGRNKDRISAYAAMTIYFHINGHLLLRHSYYQLQAIVKNNRNAN